MLTLHRAALLLPDPARHAAPSTLSASSAPAASSAPFASSAPDPAPAPAVVVVVADGAVLVQGERIAALGPYRDLAAAHPGARVRDWGVAVITPGLVNPYGRRLLEHAYHPDPREGVGSEPVPLGGGASAPFRVPVPFGAAGPDEAQYGASARRGLQRMLGYGVTAVAGPFERAAVRTAVARSGLHPLGAPSDTPPGASGASGGAEGPVTGPLDPLAVLTLAQAAHGRLEAGGRADFAVFDASALAAGFGGAAGGESGAGVGGGAGGESGEVVGDVFGGGRPGECLATVLGGRLVYRRR